MALCEKCKLYQTRSSCTINSEGRHHSFNDKPAIVWFDGDKEWYLNGKQHRENGPAIEYASGNKYWRLNGKFHRTDGPAIEYVSGNKVWYLNGKQAIQVKDQNIIVGQKIYIKDNIGIVLIQVESVFYEVLLGNKKVLIVKV